MKKFLIFLVSIIVVVCIGLTTFYFLRNDEVITINTKEIYCNAGDTISLESLGISIKKNRNKTTFNYNAGGEEVTQYINYDAEVGGYVVNGEKAGDVTVLISTTNEKYSKFEIVVHIGNGSIENPYYVFGEAELNKMGNIYRLDSHYQLMNNINLSQDFKGIGFDSTVGFGGSFNGNGYTISGLNLTNTDSATVVENAGLFASIAGTGTVSNLTLDNVSINGYYKNVGALAGTVAGSIDKIAVTNATITNLSNNSSTGAFAGTFASTVAPVKTSYVNNANIIIGNESVEAISNANVGGFVGTVDKSTIKASYANNVNITSINATAKIGGFAGKFVVAPTTGSIQQSYANVTSADANFASFIHTIEKDGDFTAEGTTMLRHLIGNFAIVSNKTSADQIVDADMVKVYDKTYFVNNTYPDAEVFFNQAATQYLIRGFASVQEVVDTNEYIFFALDSKNITNWDSEYVWALSNTDLPTLRMGTVEPSDPSAEYFAKSLEKVEIDSNPSAENGFKTLFSGKDVADYQFTLTEGVDLSGENWAPATLNNVVIDGQGNTLKIKLTSAEEVENFGLFTSIQNSTIKNLVIEIVSMDAKASQNAGGLAGIVTGTEGMSSVIENVTVKYTSPVTASYKNFGGLVGTVDNANIINCKVEGLTFAETTVIEFAGGIVAQNNNNSKVEKCSVVNSNISANNTVGGIVAINNASVLEAAGNYTITYANNGVSAVESYIGGIAGKNGGTIENTNTTVKIAVAKADAKVIVGGVTAQNHKVIKNVTINGEGISIATEVNQDVVAGGIAAYNMEAGSIELAYNYLTAVGTYEAGKNFKVGGLTYTNSGKILKAVVSSAVYGNEVAGVTVNMSTVGATIDQVLVGVKNVTETETTFAQNEIKGDKYVAGVAVKFSAGTITNIQAVSKVVGATNETNSSLLVLVFPQNATLKYASVNSSITGHGHMYKETWADFTSGAEGANTATNEERTYFGMGATSSQESSFNLYTSTNYHGKMQNVVINVNNEGVASAKGAMGIATGANMFGAFVGTQEYGSLNSGSDESFVKYVQGIVGHHQFTGSFSFNCCQNQWGGGYISATRVLDFSISTEDAPSIWTSNNGIALTFIMK